ncbi:MAG: hypothetical protein M3Q80_00440 [bacterium]|nr:hypothetical protein [bacterium]
MKTSEYNLKLYFLSIFALLLFVGSFYFLTKNAQAAESVRCTSGTLTYAQAQYAITQGGYGTGIILGTRNSSGILEINPRTGDAFVQNDTNCSLPIIAASYSIDNPNDSDIRFQTFHDASEYTIVPPHSSRTLHVDLPRCNFQADYFYGNSYPAPKADRYIKVSNFLDAGYVVNMEKSGGFSCNTTTTPPPQNPPPTTSSNTFSISCPSISSRVDLNERVTRKVRIRGGNAPFEIDWDGTDGLNGDDESITKRYTKSGKKYATVTVTDDKNRTRTAECNTIIVEKEENTNFSADLSIVCPAVPERIALFQQITRTALVSGTGRLEINWTGTDGLRGSGDTIITSYSTPGPKYATATVRDRNNREKSVECNVVIVEAPITQLALTSIPYTGLNDHPLLELFIAGFAFWGLVLASVLGYKKIARSRSTIS